MKQEDIIKAVIRKSGAAWFETNAKIFSKDRAAGVITPKCNYLQRKIQRVIDRFEELDLPIRLIVLKPRQKGSTTFLTAQTYCFLRRNAASAIIIGGQFSQVSEAWGMWQTYAKNDRFDWGNTGEVNTKSGSWSHGSKLIGETAKDVLAGIGGTHQVLHMFEVARWAKHGVANASEVMGNILKAVPLIPSSMVIMESTAEGDAGPFPTRFKGSVTAEEFLSGERELQPGSFVSVFAGWHEFSDSAMRLTEEQKKNIRDTLDAEEEYSGEKELIEMYGTTDEDGVQHLGESVKDFDVWEQLCWRRWSIREECERDKNTFDRDNPHSASVAFQKSGNVRFNQTGLAMQRRWLKLRPAPEIGVLEEVKDGVTFRPTDPAGAKVKIFERPIPFRKYIGSLDPMTGATQTGGLDPDRHGYFILRDGYWDTKGQWHRPATVARVVQSRWDVGVMEPEVWNLARMYGTGSGGCMIAIEMNKDAGFTVLLKQRGANLYMRELFDQREQKTTKALGFVTTERTREMLVETVATAIRSWDVPGAGVDIWDSDLLDQLDNFVRKDNGRSEASEGWKDDDVFSLGLGLTVIGHATTHVPSRSALGWYQPPDMRQKPAQRMPGAFS